MASEDVHFYISTAFTASSLTSLRVASRTWREAADQRHWWLALARHHFHAHLRQNICSREAFVQQVQAFRSILDRLRSSPGRSGDLERTSVTDVPSLLGIACSPQPCPPSTEDGVSLLVKCEIHNALVASVLPRLALGTPASVADCCELLDVLCKRSRKAKMEAACAGESNHTLPQILDELLMSHLPGLRELRPEMWESISGHVVVRKFGCLDCRLLSPDSFHAKGLRAVSGLHFHFYSEEADTPETLAQLSDDWHQNSQAVLASDLSGQWCSAASLNGRRLGSVPGDMQIQFDPSGTLRGTGLDEFDLSHEFNVVGFWTTAMVVMRKLASSYSVDLVGFFQPDGSIRGTWLIDTRTGGFWAWKGRPRFSPILSDLVNFS